MDCDGANKSFQIKMSKLPNLLTFVPYFDDKKDHTGSNWIKPTSVELMTWEICDGINIS